jgi:response regulator RpfG family c-di-GMP phosphodiesterase
LDVVLPDISGPEILKQSKLSPVTGNQKVILMSGLGHSDEMSQLLLNGADDFLVKPFGALQLTARVRATLRLKEAQDRSEQLKNQLLAANAELGTSISKRDTDLVRTRAATIRTLTRVLIQRQAETDGHLERMQRYCRILSQAIGAADDVSPVNDSFIENLDLAVPLHDIGKIALPDHILLKPGKFDDDERFQMQEHAVLGAQTLRLLEGAFDLTKGFLSMAIDIAQNHHERFDGSGYPNQLKGDEIPLAARIVAVADVYDALRTRKSYKPGLSHQTAMLSLTNAGAGQFDPSLLTLFKLHAADFDQVFREIGD